jgi:hypothetical protein
MKKLSFVILFVFFCAGCARVQEPFKIIWGSSTKALEDARPTATVKTYECLSSDCFDKIMEIIKRKEKKEIRIEQENRGDDVENIEIQGYETFIKDRKKGLIVVMGVPKSETTTEVGIFITAVKEKETKIEVVSLSSAAQATVSTQIFQELDKAFPPIVEIPL